MSAESEFRRKESVQLFETVRLIEELLARDTLTQIELISLGTLVHNAYSGVERILRCELMQREVDVGKGASWHKDLLVAAHEKGLLDESQFDRLGELLGFRHMYVHGYAHLLKETRILPLASAVPKLIREFVGEQ